MMRFDWLNPQVVFAAQALFVGVAACIYLVNQGLPGRVAADPTPVWYKEAPKGKGLLSALSGGAAPEDGAPVRWIKTTRGEFERSLATQKATSTVAALLFPAFFSFWMKIH